MCLIPLSSAIPLNFFRLFTAQIIVKQPWNYKKWEKQTETAIYTGTKGKNVIGRFSRPLAFDVAIFLSKKLSSEQKEGFPGNAHGKLRKPSEALRKQPCLHLQDSGIQSLTSAFTQRQVFSFSNCETKKQNPNSMFGLSTSSHEWGWGRGQGVGHLPLFCALSLSHLPPHTDLLGNGPASGPWHFVASSVILSLEPSVAGTFPPVQFSASSLNRASLPRWRFLISSPPHLSPAYHSIHSTRA